MSTDIEKAATAQCPVCATARVQRTARFKGVDAYRCGECGHRFTLLRSMSTQALESIYEEHYHGFREDAFFQKVIRDEIRLNFLPRIAPPARVLDVGCGNGEFLTAAREAGYDVEGIDISEAAAVHCRERGLKAVSGDFLSYPLDGNYDFITMWDVIEHLLDPLPFLSRGLALLKPGGYLVVKTPSPNAASHQVSSVVPRLGGMLLHIPNHVQFFDQKTLEMGFRKCGFDSVDWLPMDRMRGPAPTKSWKKKLARSFVRVVHSLGPGGNLYAAARKPSHGAS